MPESQNTFNFHSGPKCWSHQKAYEGEDKFLKLKIARKLHFLMAKRQTLKFADTLTNGNKNEISPLSNVELNGLLGIFIRFWPYPIVNKKLPPQMKQVEANFQRKTSYITKKSPMKSVPTDLYVQLEFFSRFYDIEKYF